MKKTPITLATLTLLVLSACGDSETAQNPQPETTTTTANTPATTQAVATHTPKVHKPSQPVTTASTPTTTAPAQAFTHFEGSIATGETVTFEILPADAQTYLNQAGKTAGLKGSWGALCSTELTANQLGGYTVVTTENNGNGHAHEWKNFLKVDRKMEPTLDQAMENSLIEYVQGQAKHLGECFPLQTELTSGGEQEYPSASIGQTIQGELNGATELTGK